MSVPILVDCDTGIDDALALMYLIASDADIRGITTVGGNNTAQQAAVNTLRVLELLGRSEIPVAIGSEATLRGGSFDYAPAVHGERGLGRNPFREPQTKPSGKTAVDLIIETARSVPDLQILAIGPLTNLARALEAEPSLSTIVKRVTVMGGAIHHPGNGTPAAEANIHNDPEAADKVFNAAWDVVVVPLDVTMKEVVTEDHFRKSLNTSGNVTSFILDIIDIYFDFHNDVTFGRRCGVCHDPLAAAIAVGHEVATLAPKLKLQVDFSQGVARGATIADTRGMYRGFPVRPDANVTVVLGTEPGFVDRMVARIRVLDERA